VTQASVCLRGIGTRVVAVQAEFYTFSFPARPRLRVSDRRAKTWASGLFVPKLQHATKHGRIGFTETDMFVLSRIHFYA
jgi:hypothetical protein